MDRFLRLEEETQQMPLPPMRLRELIGKEGGVMKVEELRKRKWGAVLNCERGIRGNKDEWE